MNFIFFFLLLTAIPLWAQTPCGLEGSLEERIKSCASAKENFVLVTRTDKGIEIFKDTKTGLIWSDRLSMDFNHYGSQKACHEDLTELTVFKGLKWRLPSIREFEQAAAHGMKDVLSRMNYWFWTSTPVKKRYRRRRRAPSQSYLWDGSEQKSDVGDLKDAASVRCVAR